MMTSSRTITLFAESPPSSRAPSPFVGSMLLHGAVIAVLYLAIWHSPQMYNRLHSGRYTVRILNLQRTDPKTQQSSGAGVRYPALESAKDTLPPGSRLAPPRSVHLQLHPAPQTLVQPDLPPNLLLPQQTPIPAVLMWSPKNAPLKTIVPPPPQETTTADVRPSIDPPNEELKLAEIPISSTAFVTEALALLPTTTSPVVIDAPQRVEQVPETASKPFDPPTLARVMSISDFHLKEGTITLPLANETAASDSSETLTSSGHSQSSTQAGEGNSASHPHGIGVAQIAGNGSDTSSAAVTAVALHAANAGPDQGAGTSSGSVDDPATVRIALPKDGKFGVVVVGASLTEEYPELAALWGGRMAYTVYLHVGLAKSWVLQYSLPRAEEAAAAGNISHLEAPWPYDIVRPTLAPGDSNGEAIMVHGFVNAAGHFEQLAIVFPPEFRQTAFVLRALQQWQFKPAMRNGQLTTVEVLLIIPSVPE